MAHCTTVKRRLGTACRCSALTLQLVGQFHIQGNSPLTIWWCSRRTYTSTVLHLQQLEQMWYELMYLTWYSNGGV